MTESETVAKLVRDLGDACNAVWQQPGYKQGIFETFCESPLDVNGVPKMTSDVWTSLIQAKLGRSSREYKKIEPTMREVAVAWDEWRYAVINFHKLAIEMPSA